MPSFRSICCLLSAILLTGTVTVAQQKKKTGSNGLYNINEIGVQFSDAKGLVLRAIGGYHFAGHFQVGAGIGLDDYTVRSVPLFADFRYNLNSTPNTFFAYSGAGVSMPWPTHTQYPDYYDKKPDKTSPGLYTHVGLGYKTRFGQHAFHIAAGYTHAAVKLKYIPWTIMPEPAPVTYITYEYKFNRVSIVAGITL